MGLCYLPLHTLSLLRLLKAPSPISAHWSVPIPLANLVWYKCSQNSSDVIWFAVRNCQIHISKVCVFGAEGEESAHAT